MTVDSEYHDPDSRLHLFGIAGTEYSHSTILVSLVVRFGALNLAFKVDLSKVEQLSKDISRR